MSLIETMRNSAPLPQHQQALGSVIELQKLLTEFNPAFQVEQSILQVQTQIAEMTQRLEAQVTESTQRMANQITDMTRQVESTSAMFGELIAQEVAGSTQGLVEILKQAQDVSSNLNTMLEQSEKPVKDSITALIEAKKALILIQEPKATPKDPMTQAIPWLLLGSIVLNLATLAMVLVRG